MNIVDRFLKYVSFCTTSDEATNMTPSTPGQMEFARYLANELKQIGLTDVTLDENGYIMATLPANVERMNELTSERIPVVGFIAHMDTAPDASGKNVQARIASPQPSPEGKGAPTKGNPVSPPLGGAGGGCTWLHALDRLERPLPLPLFGEDLLGTLPFAPICLVESEKTALIARLWRPDCTWLATGGKSTFTADRCRVLAGRTVHVWPDADAIGEWMEAAATLGPQLDIRFQFPTAYLTRIREGPPKADLADLIQNQLT